MFTLRYLLILCALTPTASVQVVIIAAKFRKEGDENKFANFWYGTDIYGVDSYFTSASHGVSFNKSLWNATYVDKFFWICLKHVILIGVFLLTQCCKCKSKIDQNLA